MSTQVRSEKPFEYKCCCCKFGGPPEPRTYETEGADGFQGFWIKSFDRKMPISMFDTPCKAPLCCLYGCVCAPIAACTQRQRILKLEGKDYYRCLNLDDRLARIWCCAEDSCFQKCNIVDHKFEGDCMIRACALCEACVCLSSSALANRWSVQRLGGYEGSPCEDRVVSITNSCLKCWGNAKTCWKGVWLCACILAPQLQHPSYYCTGGFFCEGCQTFWKALFLSVIGCMQAQTNSALAELEQEAKDGKAVQTKSEQTWYKPLEITTKIPLGTIPGRDFEVKVPDGRVIKVKCPLLMLPGTKVIVSYQPADGQDDAPPGAQGPGPDEAKRSTME